MITNVDQLGVLIPHVTHTHSVATLLGTPVKSIGRAAQQHGRVFIYKDDNAQFASTPSRTL